MYIASFHKKTLTSCWNMILVKVKLPASEEAYQTWYKPHTCKGLSTNEICLIHPLQQLFSYNTYCFNLNERCVRLYLPSNFYTKELRTRGLWNQQCMVEQDGIQLVGYLQRYQLLKLCLVNTVGLLVKC